jgi:hypothetical protein
MKFTITIEVPDDAKVSIVSDATGEFVPPFEDELIPLPAEAIPVQGDPTPFRGMARAQTAPAVLQQSSFCPVHAKPWKLVPAGVSKKTGRPYEAFLACPERGCDQRPVS